jgi:hypothetical protein
MSPDYPDPQESRQPIGWLLRLGRFSRLGRSRRFSGLHILDVDGEVDDLTALSIFEELADEIGNTRAGADVGRAGRTALGDGDGELLIGLLHRLLWVNLTTQTV